MTTGRRAWAERVVIQASGGVPAFMRVREPAGQDELSLSGIDTQAATALLDRLVEPPLATADLAASDRDRLLATLHRGLWGDRIVSSLQCSACGAMYDLSFELTALQHALEDAREASQPSGPRRITDAGGHRYSLPSAAEEEEAAMAGGEAGRALLAARILEEVEGGIDPGELDARLEALAPILDVDIAAPCAECGNPAEIRFDIQTFAMQRLLDEREATLAEVHRLATGYGWSLSEILGLERGLRRSFAERLAVVS